MSSDKPLVEHSELYKLVTPSSPIEKTPVTGVVILGDSLSDPGGKNGEYGKKLLGCIPIDLFLHKSPHKQFTNDLAILFRTEGIEVNLAYKAKGAPCPETTIKNLS